MSSKNLELMELVFLRFGCIYGYAWQSLYPTQQIQKFAKMEWAASLEGFSETQIMRAIDVAKEKGGDFAPSLPAFVKMCMPSLELLGMPEWEEAFNLAIRRDFKREAIRLAFDSVGSFNFQSLPDKELRPKFKKIYNEIALKAQKEAMHLESIGELKLENKESRELTAAKIIGKL